MQAAGPLPVGPDRQAELYLADARPAGMPRSVAEGFVSTTSSLIATCNGHSRSGLCYRSNKSLVMSYQMRSPGQVVDRWQGDDRRFAVFHRQNFSFAARVASAAARSPATTRKIRSATVSIALADDPAMIRGMAFSGYTSILVRFESLNDANIRDQRNKIPNS